MKSDPERLLGGIAMFRALSEADRRQLASVARVRLYQKGDTIFAEGEASEVFFTIVRGRVKIFKTAPTGKHVILELFGAGDPVGAVAVYEERDYPASAMALEDTICLLLPRREFFQLLEQHPSLVRGLLAGLTHRIVELTNRIAEFSGGRVETRVARLFQKLASEHGQETEEGTFIPVVLSRQEVADLTGTTIETCIRIMSRWGKENVIRTDKNGFMILDRDVLDEIAEA
jgi:CRP-like cAMP-binding protein